ncbi:hypothetical protein BURPS305_4097 [Burkholderia pseudomallei 305]|nr:hypothetical protein BURPS305_4097 [Burkholderia pseudomallei 305]
MAESLLKSPREAPFAPILCGAGRSPERGAKPAAVLALTSKSTV